MFTRIVLDQAQGIKNMKKATELVFIPAPPVGHLASAVELAKLLVSRDDHLFTTILIMKLPYDSKATDFLIDSSAAPASNHIKFIVLKKPDVDFTNMNRNTFRKLFVESHKPQVRDVVAGLAESLSESTPRVLAGFIVDMICPTMIDVANEFGVPTYLFFPSNAAFLGVMLHHQTIADEHDLDIIDFKGSDSELVLPGFVKPLPARALPSVLLEKEAASKFANYARRYRETKGILVNTFSELESHAVRALGGSYGKVPPVFPVGPILKLNSDDHNLVEFDDHVSQKSDVLNWLDDQLPSSVVFLCFGSMGSFGLDQVKEIATALEHGGHHFLWSLRRPPCKGKIASPSEYEDFVGVLPDGFLPRTAKVGKVIGWAPQVAVLAHPAVGGFVSHCGWNSILESLWFGVPIATWPMYAEQQMNAFEMVRELGLAVEISIDYSKDCFDTDDENQMMILRAEEIERGIREVMEKDSDVRKRVKEMSEVSKKALTDGGSSYSSLGRFLDQILL